MRLYIALAALALAGFASPAYAADWRLASKGEGGAVFVDADSIQRDGKDVTFRLWAIYRERAPTGTDNVQAHRRGNCGDYTFADLERLFRYGREQIDRSANRPTAQANPGTHNHSILRYACDGPVAQPDPSYPDPYEASKAEGFWRD